MERMLDCDGDHGIGRGGTMEANPAMAPILFCHGLWPPPPAKKQNLFSLHFPNFCDYLVKKIVYEIRNVTSLRGTSSLRNLDYMSSGDHACLGEHIMVREIIICSHRHQHTINVWSKFLKIM